MRTHLSGLSVPPSASTECCWSPSGDAVRSQAWVRARVHAPVRVIERVQERWTRVGMEFGVGSAAESGFSPLPGMCATLIVQGFVKSADARLSEAAGQERRSGTASRLQRYSRKTVSH